MINKSNTMIELLVLLIAATCVMASCAKVEEKRDPIKIGINIWPGYAYAFIAQEKGFFKKNNVDVELILKKDITESKELYKNGEVDGLFDVFSDIIMLNVKGISTQVVYVVDYSDAGDVIIGRPEYNSLVDLRDKKVSFDGINSFSHMFVLKALVKVGLKEPDLKFENIPAMDVLTALEEKKIAAGHTWEPITTQALERGYKILAKAGDFPGIITDVLAFREEVIKERPDDVKQIVVSILEALDFFSSDREESLEIMSKAESMTKLELEKGIKGVHLLNLQENGIAMKKSDEPMSLYNLGKMVMNFYAQRGQLSGTIPLDKIIKPKFVDQLIREHK